MNNVSTHYHVKLEMLIDGVLPLSATERNSRIYPTSWYVASKCDRFESTWPQRVPSFARRITDLMELNIAWGSIPTSALTEQGLTARDQHYLHYLSQAWYGCCRRGQVFSRGQRQPVIPGSGITGYMHTWLIGMLSCVCRNVQPLTPSRDCNPGIPESWDPGNFPIPKSRETPGIEPHSIPGFRD